MSRADRLLRLLQALREQRQPVTSARLARATEVSERTIYRDIASLRAAGAVIEGAPGFGYRLTEDPALPPQSFARIEIEALVLGAGEVRHRGDPALAAASDAALAKIIATLPDRLQRQAIHAVLMVYRATKPAETRIDLSTIRGACWDERALDITYRARDETVTRRRILPLALVYLDQAVVLLAWCTLREDFRQFLPLRILEHALAGERFRPRRVPLLRAYIARLSGLSDKARAIDPAP